MVHTSLESVVVCIPGERNMYTQKNTIVLDQVMHSKTVGGIGFAHYFWLCGALMVSLKVQLNVDIMA
jgi:hypothetical protein